MQSISLPLSIDFSFARYKFESRKACVDNGQFHKTSAVSDLIFQRGFYLEYLPPYSPFFNPIENTFSKWKDFAKCCNNETGFIASIMNGKNSVTAFDCTGFL